MKSCLQTILFVGLFAFLINMVFFSETNEENNTSTTTSKKAKKNRYNNSYSEYDIKEDENYTKFSELDNYAKQVPLESSQNIQDLANYLMQRAKTEEEKARALFIWIVYNIDYDTEVYLQNIKKPASYYKPEFIVQHRKTVCSGYAYLYQAIAEKMGLETYYIVGDVKGTYKSIENPGLIEEHAWNGVKIDNKFYLVDCTWAAGSTDKNQNFKRDINMEWYHVSPKQFIFSHAAKKEKLQGLEKPISLKQFKEMPHIRPGAFQAKILNEEKLFADFIEGKKMAPLPQYWAAKVPLKAIKIPMDKTLKAGIEYSFEVESPYLYEVFVINEVDGKNEYHSASLENNRFVLNTSLKTGTAKFVLRHSKQEGDNSYPVAIYEVL